RGMGPGGKLPPWIEMYSSGVCFFVGFPCIFYPGANPVFFMLQTFRIKSPLPPENFYRGEGLVLFDNERLQV
ncbi:MAG: hypothetical protein ACLFT1_09075, partial [Desulfonatronovibrio sp.]